MDNLAQDLLLPFWPIQFIKPGQGEFMAEVTKRKIASIYSLIAGFFLSLFSGHAHSGELFKATTSKSAGNARQFPTVYKTNVTPNTVSTGINTIQAPNTIPNGINTAPAPEATRSTSTVNAVPAGINTAPAPGMYNAEVMNAQMIEDSDAREFILNKADAQGIDSSNLSRDFVNSTMIEYLMKEVESLKMQLQNK